MCSPRAFQSKWLLRCVRTHMNIGWSARFWIDCLVDWLVVRLIGWLIVRLADQVCWSAGWLVDWLHGSLDWLHGWLIGWMVGRFGWMVGRFGWLVDQQDGVLIGLAGWFVGWFCRHVGWWIDRFIGCLMGWLTGCLIGLIYYADSSEVVLIQPQKVRVSFVEYDFTKPHYAIHVGPGGNNMLRWCVVLVFLLPLLIAQLIAIGLPCKASLK